MELMWKRLAAWKPRDPNEFMEPHWTTVPMCHSRALWNRGEHHEVIEPNGNRTLIRLLLDSNKKPHGTQETLMEPRLQCVTEGPHGTQENIVRLWNNMAPRFYYGLKEPHGSKEPLWAYGLSICKWIFCSLLGCWWCVWLCHQCGGNLSTLALLLLLAGLEDTETWVWGGLDVPPPWGRVEIFQSRNPFWFRWNVHLWIKSVACCLVWLPALLKGLCLEGLLQLKDKR